MWMRDGQIVKYWIHGIFIQNETHINVANQCFQCKSKCQEKIVLISISLIALRFTCEFVVLSPWAQSSNINLQTPSKYRRGHNKLEKKRWHTEKKTKKKENERTKHRTEITPVAFGLNDLNGEQFILHSIDGNVRKSKQHTYKKK